MTIVLRTEHVRAIEAHARKTYPEECCGLLLGRSAASKRVDEPRPATNVAETNRERRYVIDPRAIFSVDHELRGTGREILGFYHSHPDHPAQPSAFDEAQATWPGYSYVILSIVDGNPAGLRSWVLEKEGGRFRPETLSTAEV